MNCPKCLQPVPEGEKFCRNCGSPIPASATPPINGDLAVIGSADLPRSRKGIYLTIAAIVVGLALIGGLVFWLISSNKDGSQESLIAPVADDMSADSQAAKGTKDADAKKVDEVADVEPAVPGAGSSDTDKKPFVFQGKNFEFGWQGGSVAAGQVMYEFVPEGETVNNWNQLVTIVRNTGKKLTAGEIGPLFAATMDQMVSKGAVIHRRSETDGMNVAIFSFIVRSSAEVDIKKVFLVGGDLVSVTYGVRLAGKDEQDIKQKVADQLQKMEGLQKVFLDTRFPLPWLN